MPTQCICQRPGCGAPFVQKPNTLGLYCSNACSAAMRVTLVEIICQVCGKPRMVKPSVIAKGFGTYCGTSCANVVRFGHTEEQFWAAFWAKTRPDGDCLIWTGKKGWDRHGEYGLVWVGPRATRRRRRTHRLALERKLGRPLKEGFQANHTCDRMLCVNQDHLYEGTQQQNVDDMFARGRANKARGERNGSSKLTEAQVREIKLALAEGYPQEMLAEEYGVVKQAIQAISCGRTWAWVII